MGHWQEGESSYEKPEPGQSPSRLGCHMNLHSYLDRSHQDMQ